MNNYTLHVSLDDSSKQDLDELRKSKGDDSSEIIRSLIAKAAKELRSKDDE